MSLDRVWIVTVDNYGKDLINSVWRTHAGADLDRQRVVAEGYTPADVRVVSYAVRD